MKTSYPPRLAVWLLKHFGPEVNLEVLTGDLHEAFTLGKSNAWYWRQVLAAIYWRKHASMFLIPIAFGWFITSWWDFGFSRLLYIAILTVLFLGVRYLPEVIGGKLGVWLHRALVIFFFLLYYPLSVLLLLILVIHRKASPRYPDVERQRLIENLHMSLMQETDHQLCMAYEQAIRRLKSSQAPDSTQSV